MTEAPVHRYDSVESTMDLVHRLAEEGAPAGTVVVAAEQTAGRGSRGRRWRSPRGGLWLSLLLRPGQGGGELLSLRAGLAIAEGLERADPGLQLGLKWPNDLMWGDRKLGGVLCEARWTGAVPAWVAIGVGINVRNPIPAELASTAVWLVDRLPEATPDAVLDLVLPGLRALDADSSRLGDDELDRLRRRDWLRGRPVRGAVAGVAEGIAADGTLLVRRADGSVDAVRAGPVELADGPASP